VSGRPNERDVMNTPPPTRLLAHGPAYLLGLGVTFALSALAGMAFAPGCSSKACTATSLDGVPEPAVDCPAGTLCYLGACLRACSAGQERSTRCTSDGECSAARPRCVDGFCSSCDRGDYCVPTLNVCRPVVEFELPDAPPMPMPGPRPPQPLDGGALDGSFVFPGLKSSRDAGAEEPTPEQEVTRAGFIDLAETLDLRNVPPTPGREAQVRVFNVSGNGPGKKWRVDVDPPAVETVESELGPCSLRALTSSVAVRPRPASLGPILVDSHPDHPDSITRFLRFIFSEGFGYGLAEPLGTEPLLVFSGTNGPSDIRYLSVSSAGLPTVTAASWPNAGGAFFGHQVPFRVRPTSTTEALLSTSIEVTNPPSADLTFAWERINSGNDALTRVQVRIPAPDFEIVCTAFEGMMGSNTIVVRAQLLAQLRAHIGAQRVPVLLERASTVRAPITPAEGQLIDVTVRVRHTLSGELVFR
jgi:hypothetical protein